MATSKTLREDPEVRILKEKIAGLEAELKIRSEELRRMKSLLRVEEVKQQESKGQLAESEARFRAAIENSSDGISIISYGKRSYVNRKWLNMFGCSTVEEGLSLSLMDTIYPEDREKVECYWDKRRANEPAPEGYEYRALKKDGTVFWVETSTAPIPFTDYESFFIFSRDITDRKLSERAIHDREAELRALFDDSPVALMEVNCSEAVAHIEELRRSGVTDFHTYIDENPEVAIQCLSGTFFERANRATLALYGMHSIEDFRESSKYYLSHTPAENLKDSFLAIAEKRKTYDRELFRTTVDGRRLYLHAKWTVLSGYEETMEKMIFCDVDMTKAKLVEDALLESEQRYRTAIENSNDGVAIVKAGVHIYVNRKWLDMFGYDNFDELTGIPATQMVHPDDRDMVAMYTERRQRNEPAPMRYEFKGIKKNGTPFYVEVSLSPVIYGGINASFIFFRDVTEKRRILEALSESEQRYRTAIEKSNDGIAIVIGKEHVYVNRRWLDMFGYDSEDEVLHKDFSLVHPDDEERITGYGRNREKGILDPVRYEFHALKKNGDSIFVEASLSPVSFQGKPAHFAFIRDVTERKQTEEELRKAKEGAEAAAQAKSNFLSNMSHEIRTPMNAIVGLSHLALKTNPESVQKNYLTKIESSSRILLGVINSVLDLAKMEAHKMTINENEFYLTKMVNDVLDMFASEAASKNLELIFHCDPFVPDVLIGDSLRLSQILTNLVGNAVKFTNFGSVRVLVTAEEKARDEVALTFAVSDTGIGIGTQEQVMLFQPFTQLDSSASRKYAGTGLGLAISRDLVHLMGGTLFVESVRDMGSTFTFTIPVKFRPDAMPISMKTSEGGENDVSWEKFIDLKGSRVLVVEDNVINMEVAEGILREFGIIVEKAWHGAQALDFLSLGDHRFDAVLLDIQMPDMDGYEVARLIRRKLHDLEIPLIAMTAHVGEEERMRCLGAGMNDHVPKPLEPRQLNAVLSSWIVPPEIVQKAGRPEIPASPAFEHEQTVLLPDAFPGLNVQAALRRLSGNKALLRKLLNDFCRDYANGAEEIRHALKSHDTVRARRVAHTVRGASGNLSIMAVHKLSAAIEEAIDSKQEFTIDLMIDDLNRAIGAVVAAVSDRENLSSSAEQKKSRDGDDTGDEDRESVLSEIYVLLSKRNIRARRLFARLINQKNRETAGPYLAQCEEALKKLDFCAAQALIVTIARQWGVTLPQEEKDDEKTDSTHSR
jgi:PAS domain S-box-containing protein